MSFWFESKEESAGEGKPGEQTPWACVDEKCYRAWGGGSRQGREKRRRRKGAGVVTPRRGEEGVWALCALGAGAAGKCTPLAWCVGGAVKLMGGRPKRTVSGRAQAGSRGDDAGEVLEGECKVTSGVQVVRVTPTDRLPSGIRQGPY